MKKKICETDKQHCFTAQSRPEDLSSHLQLHHSLESMSLLITKPISLYSI